MKTDMKENIPQSIRERAWYVRDGVYAFLVDAPLTLGHSQLRVTINSDQKEEDAFQIAAVHIVKCIEVLRTTLCNLDLGEWEALVNYTETSGEYKKTLVLKTSANEGENEYKIHLAPYFQSHLDLTNQLYKKSVPNPNESGGLLHWVGQREWIVDCDMQRGRADEIVKKRIASFNLPGLALKLSAQDEVNYE